MLMINGLACLLIITSLCVIMVRTAKKAALFYSLQSYMEEFLDITPGSVSIMGLMNDTDNHVQLLMDKEVLEGETLGCHPCINTSSLKLKTKEVMEKFLPAVHHEAVIVELPRYEEHKDNEQG